MAKAGKSTMREWLDLIITLVITLIVLFFVKTYLFETIRVDGQSMMPTLENRDRLFLNKLAKPERFDVVVFPAPNEPDEKYIKRVIGLPGDKVSYKNDELYINDKLYKEPYLAKYKADMHKQKLLLTNDFDLMSVARTDKVPADSYFVMGDNRQNSLDSREIGFIHKDKVMGVSTFRYYPFNHIGNFEKQAEK